MLANFPKSPPPKVIDDNTNRNKIMLYMKLEKSGMVAFIYSYLCTIVSCFIFSKIMYGIQTKCMDLYKYLDHVKNFVIMKLILISTLHLGRTKFIKHQRKRRKRFYITWSNVINILQMLPLKHYNLYNFGFYFAGLFYLYFIPLCFSSDPFD